MGGPRLNAQRATGTTTDAFVVALSVKSIRNLAYVLKNTHGSNSLDFKIDGYLQDSGFSVALKASAALAATAQTDDSIPNLLAKYRDVAFSKIDISVKATSAGNQATYDLSANGLSAEP